MRRVLPHGFKRPMPRQRQPDAIRLRYFALLRPFLAEMHRACLESLAPVLAELPKDVRTDASPKDIRGVIKKISKKVIYETFDSGRLQRVADKIFGQTADYQKKELLKQLNSQMGFDPLIRDRKLLEQVQAFTKENVALIKTVPERYFAQVEEVTLQGVREGLRAEDLAAQLTERANVSEVNAQRIARDQIGKAYGALNEARQTELGISKFQWFTMMDNRVREEHEALQGQIFNWDDPPPEGIPGFEINCRCFADPLLDDVE